jgi:hypothetical protein
VWNVNQLITEQLIDYMRATVVHAGGITHLRRIFDLASLYHVRTGSHGATNLSPVTLAAAVHVDIALPNFGIQEYMPHADETMEASIAAFTSRTACFTRLTCRVWASSTTKRRQEAFRTSGDICPSRAVSTRRYTTGDTSTGENAAEGRITGGRWPLTHLHGQPSGIVVMSRPLSLN